jgi:glycosyltransferase involved in cell wall biosynthesis
MVNKYYSPPHLGGIEVVVRHLSEGLVRCAGAQVRALVCNESRRRVEESVSGVEVLRLPRHLRISAAPVAAGMPGALRTAARGSDRCDILHFHSPYPWGELSLLASRPHVPSVVLYHSDIVRQKRLLAAYRPFLERFLDQVDLIIVSSPNMMRHSPFLTPRAAKCRVVPFGLPLEHVAESSDAPRRAAELRGAHAGRRIVLFVGRLVYYKGVDVLIRAMADLDADLVLIVDGPLESELRGLAREVGVAARSTFLSPASDAELAAWYHAADVLCLPSVARSEAFGLVQIEAHAAGTPVVSTNLPTGVPYANLDSVTGLIVPPGDAAALAGALRRLLADDCLRLRLGAQARSRALSEFTVPRMVEGTLQVYAEAADVHARRQGTA